MEIRVSIQRADVWQVSKHISFLVPRRAIPLYLSLLVLLWSVFSGVISGMATRPLGFKIVTGVVTTAIIAGPICLLFYWLWRWVTMRNASKTPGVLGEHLYTISAAGLREQTAVNDGLTAWHGVTSIVETREHLYFFLGPCLAHVIPQRAFPTEEESKAFLALSRSYWEAARK